MEIGKRMRTVRWIRVGLTHGTSVVTKTGWRNGSMAVGRKQQLFSHISNASYTGFCWGPKIYGICRPNLARYPLHVGASDSGYSAEC